MNYVNTFIEVAADTKATDGTVPKARETKSTVAELEYKLISPRPYTYTQEDVQFRVHAMRTGLPTSMPKSEKARVRAEFFTKPMACMRTSPLAKSYGWGLHFNDKGHVALVSVNSAEYKRLAQEPGVVHTRAMSSKRA